MKLTLAILCLLLSLGALLLAIDASGSLQDAPPLHSQTVWTLPYTAAFLVLGATSIFLFVKIARRGL